MKNTSGLMVLAIFCCLLPKTAKANDNLVNFDKRFCRTVNRKSIVTVCISGNPERFNLNSKALDRLKKDTKSLVKEYYQASIKALTENPPPLCTYDDWDPVYCDDPDHRSFCDAVGGDSRCLGTTNILNDTLSIKD